MQHATEHALGPCACAVFQAQQKTGRCVVVNLVWRDTRIIRCLFTRSQLGSMMWRSAEFCWILQGRGISSPCMPARSAKLYTTRSSRWRCARAVVRCGPLHVELAADLDCSCVLGRSRWLSSAQVNRRVRPVFGGCCVPRNR